MLLQIQVDTEMWCAIKGKFFCINISTLKSPYNVFKRYAQFDQFIGNHLYKYLKETVEKSVDIFTTANWYALILIQLLSKCISMLFVLTNSA